MTHLIDIRVIARRPEGGPTLPLGPQYLASEAYVSGMGKIRTSGARLLNVIVYQLGALSEPQIYPTEPDGRDGLIADEIRLEADLVRLALAPAEEQVLSLLDLIHEGTTTACRVRGWQVDVQLEAARRSWGDSGFTSFDVLLIEKLSRDKRHVAKLVATISIAGMELKVVAETRDGGLVAESDVVSLGYMTLATRNSFPGQLKWLSSNEVALQPKSRRRFDDPLHEVTLRIPDVP